MLGGYWTFFALMHRGFAFLSDVKVFFFVNTSHHLQLQSPGDPSMSSSATGGGGLVLTELNIEWAGGGGGGGFFTSLGLVGGGAAALCQLDCCLKSFLFAGLYALAGCRGVWRAQSPDVQGSSTTSIRPKVLLLWTRRLLLFPHPPTKHRSYLLAPVRS